MEKFDWLLHFKKKDISLAEAVSIYLKESGAPALLTQLYDDAVDRYKSGEIVDLAEGLGIAMSMDERRDENDMRRNPAKWAEYIRGLVDDFRERGYSLTKPAGATTTTTAFHMVAGMQGMTTQRGAQMSPVTVWEIYYRGETKAAKTRAANKRKKVG